MQSQENQMHILHIYAPTDDAILVSDIFVVTGILIYPQ